MVERLDYIRDKRRYSDLMVLRSGAGWYIGTIYTNPPKDGGFQEPGSRDSIYFATEAEAEAELAYWEANGPRNNRWMP